jgi:transcriptional regulator with XRE-family HTH domain
MNESDLSPLARRLREARTAAGLSVRQLAVRVGAHHGYIARIETGERRPSAEYLQKIAEVLNIEPSELFAYIGIKPSNILPKPRDYFLRALGASEEEADMLADVVQYLHKQKEKPSDDTEQERHDGPD